MKWVDVKDYLPEENAFVYLVYTNCRNHPLIQKKFAIYIAWFMNGKFYPEERDSGRNFIDSVEITHWMDLPDPPDPNSSHTLKPPSPNTPHTPQEPSILHPSL